jgi:hypothetical protein
MFLSKITSEEIICHIESFIGPNYWKITFSKKVLPRLNKKWKLVGSMMPFENIPSYPCPNCYVSGDGINIGCLNMICDNSMEICVKKEDIFDCDWWKWAFSTRVLPYVKQ